MTDHKNRLERRVALDMEHALKQLQSERGEVLPVTVIEPKSGPWMVFLTPFGDAQEKRIMQTIIRIAAIACDAEMISMLHETWFYDKSLEPGEAALDVARNAIAPSESENRREGVLCLILYRDPIDGVSRRIHSEMREIEREWNGKVTGLKSLSDDFSDPTGGFSGPTAELMPSARPDPFQQGAAKAALDELMKLTGAQVSTVDPATVH